MAAPNTLIINNRTVIDASHVVRAAQAVFDSAVSVGNTQINTGAMSTPYFTTSTLQLNGNGTATGTFTVTGTVSAGGFSTTGSLTVGNVTLNGNVTSGNMTLRNNYLAVGRFIADDTGFTSPSANITTMKVTGAFTVDGLTSLNDVNTRGNFIFGGNYYTNTNVTRYFRSANNGILWGSEGMQNDGLYYLNMHHANGDFRYTLFRAPGGPNTTDTVLSIGIGTKVNGALTSAGLLTASQSMSVGNSLTVTGNTTLNSSLSVAGQTIMQNFEARNDSRVLRNATPTIGVLYFGNGDKNVAWDGANWIIRGGSLFATNLVADNGLTVGANVQVNGSIKVNSSITSNANINSVSINTSSFIRTGSEIRITGYGTGGLLRLGTTDSVYMYYDAGRFLFSGGNAEFSNGVLANDIAARGGNVYTHHNDASGSVYFGNQNGAYLDFNGTGKFTISHALYGNGGGDFLAVNSRNGVTGNTMRANYIASNGDIDAAGNMSANVVNVQRLHSFGTGYAVGNFGSGDSFIAENKAWGKQGLLAGPNQEVSIVGESSTGNGKIFAKSTKLYLENVYVYSLVNTSDVRLKDIDEAGYMTDAQALSRISALETIKFNWKQDVPSPSSQPHYGFKAQQVQEIIPDIVHDNGDFLSVAQMEMIPLMVSSIRELKREINELRAALAGTKPTRRKKV